MTKGFKGSILGTIYRLVYNNTKNNIIYVRASCWASYKRNVKYKMKMICSQSGTPKILAAKCDRQLSDFQQWVLLSCYGSYGNLRTWQESHYYKCHSCCTLKLREWGKGSRREVEFSPVMALKTTKPRHAPDSNKPRRTLFRNNHSWSMDSISHFLFLCFSFLRKKGNGLALFAELSLIFSRAVFHDIGDSEQGLIKFQNVMKAR